MINPVWTGTVKGGKFKPDRPEFKQAFYGYEGKPVEVAIRCKRKHRSGNQNRYYYGVVLPLIHEATGYTIDEAHTAMKMLFLVKRDCKIPTCRSTSDLSTEEMETYLENIRRFASTELNYYVPQPNEIDIPHNV